VRLAIWKPTPVFYFCNHWLQNEKRQNIEQVFTKTLNC
jgi:hypothetical protein